MKGSKGLELPINVIVIVAIAVLVLVVAAALFSGQVSQQTGAINIETAYTKGCQTLRAVYNCNVESLDNIKPGYTTSQGTELNLLQICQQKFPGADIDIKNVCVQNCGCPVTGPYCGNRKCDPGESKTTCPSDCPS